MGVWFFVCVCVSGCWYSDVFCVLSGPCLSPSALSPVKLLVFATTWLLSISLQPSLVNRVKERVRDYRKEEKIQGDSERKRGRKEAVMRKISELQAFVCCPLSPPSLPFLSKATRRSKTAPLIGVGYVNAITTNTVSICLA